MPYYYRGTTRAWPGNNSLSENRLTYVSTDPLVVTFFAIACRNHGAAVVLVISQQKFEVAIPEDPDNPVDQKIDEDFNAIECAIQLAVSPSEFESGADLVVDVDLAIEVLNELGFTGIPVRLSGRIKLDEELRDTYTKEQRLSLRQIEEFDAKIRERMR